MIRFKTNNITSSSLLGQPLAKSLDGGTLALARGGMQFQADRSCLQSPHLHSGQRPFKNPKTCSFRFCQTHLGSSMLVFHPWETWIRLSESTKRRSCEPHSLKSVLGCRPQILSPFGPPKKRINFDIFNEEQNRLYKIVKKKL